MHSVIEKNIELTLPDSGSLHLLRMKEYSNTVFINIEKV